MTKKVLSIILSLLLGLACCVPAFAADDLDIESILASDIAQEILATEGMTDISNIVIDVIANAGSIDIAGMGKDKAVGFVQSIINMVGGELQDQKTNIDAFATNPMDIVDRLFDTEIKDTVSDMVDKPENDENDLQFIYGDADLDGVVTTADARIILRAAVELIVLNETQAYYADVDGDGYITTTDARIALRIATGLETIDAYL